MTAAPTPLLRRYFQALERLGHKPGNVRFYVEYLFEGIDLAGKTVLDVGAGDGRFSFYAACAGATKVVALEPEAAGSVRGRSEKYEEMSKLLEPHVVELAPYRLQDYEPDGRAFDVLLSHASINHLEEEACMRLHEDPAAQEKYVAILRRLAGLARPEATLIVVDCARRNLFSDLHLPHPIARAIAWEKHQAPELWAKLLIKAGFVDQTIRWNSFNTLRKPGRILLGNRFASYCLTSTFCLTMRRAVTNANDAESAGAVFGDAQP